MKSIVIFLMVLIQTARCNPSIEIPAVMECGKDAVIICKGNETLSSYSWYFNDSNIASKAGVSDHYTSKYSTAVNGTTISLTVHNIDAVKDAGTYACDYGYIVNISKSLKTECKATGIDFKIESDKTILISADRLYPNEVKFKTRIWSETDGQDVTIVQGSVRCNNSKGNNGYFRCNWQSTTAVPYGDYFYSVIVATITDTMPFNGSFLIASPRSPVFINTIGVNGIGEVIRGNEGDDLTVKCVSRGGYPRPNVVLYVNDSSLSDNVTSTLNTTYIVTTEHTFKSIPRSYDGASLHCRSSYNGSKSIQSTTVQLNLYSFPIITKPAAREVSSMLNACASIEFDFFSNAGQHQIECFKNISGDDVIECSKESSTTMITLPVFDTEVETDGFKVLINIHTRSKDDFGMYTIKVTNEIGESTFSLHVEPSGPPCVPYNVSVDEITETSATLSWIRCFRGGFDQTVVIQLSKDGVLWNNKTFIEGGHRSMNMTPITNYLHSLESTSTYYIRMFAYNHIDRSNYSESIIFTTKSVAVPTLPLALIGGVGGGGICLIVIIGVAFVLVMKHRRNKDHNGIQENSMYISADLIANPIASGVECIYAMTQKTVATNEKVTSDVYATVNKVHKKVSANQSSQKNENLYENYEQKQSSKGAPKRIEQPVVPKKILNKDGLQYVEVAFKNTPSGDSRLVIHGLEDRTPYAQIDFTKKADPLPDSEDEDEGKK